MVIPWWNREYDSESGKRFEELRRIQCASRRYPHRRRSRESLVEMSYLTENAGVATRMQLPATELPKRSARLHSGCLACYHCMLANAKLETNHLVRGKNRWTLTSTRR